MIEWYIDDVRVDAVEVGQPDPHRSGDLELVVLIDPASGDGESAMILGGPEGRTLGGPRGGTLGGATLDGLTRYHRLRQYLEYAGEADYGTGLGGTVFVREHPLEAWPVDSHIVAVEPGPGVAHTEAFWGLITGGSDDSQVVGDRQGVFRLTLEVVRLADRDEYDDRAELLAGLNPPLNQL